jgi:excisionase family DNA binding protein
MQTNLNTDRKYNVSEAAHYLGLSKSTLNKLRVHSGGPAYFKCGRRVVYDIRDLEAWLLRRKMSHTSELLGLKT